jgi:hypothetical protein
MSEWKDLPNAKHIDRVLASVKTHPEVWGAFRVVSHELSTIFDSVRDKAWHAIRAKEWSAAWNAVQNTVLDATREQSNFLLSHARVSAWFVLTALVAYDDCEWMLGISSEKLRVWSELTQNPAAILLLPAVVVFEEIEEKENI